MTAEQYASYAETRANAYVGVGITIEQHEDGYLVTEISDGGPAEEAGMRYGDILIFVDGDPTTEMDMATLKSRVRGEEGTTVELTVLRGEEEITMTVERRTITTVVVTGSLLENGIGYVQITDFDERSAASAIAVIKELTAQGATSLVFDVRNNPGGYRVEMVQLLDYLLPEGEIFRMVSTQGEESIDYSDANCIDLPMTVLVGILCSGAAGIRRGNDYRRADLRQRLLPADLSAQRWQCAAAFERRVLYAERQKSCRCRHYAGHRCGYDR